MFSLYCVSLTLSNTYMYMLGCTSMPECWHLSASITVNYLENIHHRFTPPHTHTHTQTHAYYATKEKPSAVLPSFPNINRMELPTSLSRDKMHTFMVMYRAHCQRILDSVVRATFNEVSCSGP